MIYLRSDDIMVHSTGWGSGTDRFKQQHRWVLECPDMIMHMPAILVKEIQEYPECIEFVKEETNAGRMKPELHGYQHVQYKTLPPKEIREHIEKSLEWFDKELDWRPRIFALPWGKGKEEVIESTIGEYKEQGVTSTL